MKAVVQRVFSASVSVDGELVSEIGKGILVFLGVGEDDTKATADKAIAKISGLRIFCDERGKMFYSVKDIEGEILCISNFTLYGNPRHGFRPDFTKAAPYDTAKELYEYSLERFSESVPCKGGSFGADMRVWADNDGPVTILINTDEL